MMNCVIVDDEPLAREGIAGYVADVDFLRLTGVCENPVDLVKMMDNQPVDLIFLDIQMPKMSGIDFLKMIQQPPMVIITTAYPDFALEGFQLNVLDYLVKPVTFDRFFKSVNKAKEYFQLRNKRESPVTSKIVSEDHFFIRCGSRYEKIYFEEILFVEGAENYSTIHTLRGKFMTLMYLKNVSEQLDPAAFIRVHKSYIVAAGKIGGIDGNEIFIGKEKIPLSRNYRDQVMEQVVSRKLWVK
jgi:two-component system LytT family response regulator